MILPSKDDFFNAGFTERQSDVLVEIFRAIRRARFFYLQFFSYAACCSLLIVFLFILHSCYQLNSIQRHVQTNQTLIRNEHSAAAEGRRAVNRRLTGIETELKLRRSLRP